MISSRQVSQVKANSPYFSGQMVRQNSCHFFMTRQIPDDAVIDCLGFQTLTGCIKRLLLDIKGIDNTCWPDRFCQAAGVVAIAGGGVNDHIPGPDDFPQGLMTTGM